MKKVIIMVAIAVAMAVVAGCASAPEQDAPPSGRTGVPGFVLNPPQADDAIYGVGVGTSSRIDMARRQATGRAREDIAFQMNAAIQASIVDYAQEAGADGNDPQVISFYETVSRQVTDTTLEGATPEEFDYDDDGNLWALVVLPKSSMLNAAAEAFQRNEDAAFAQFQADQALQALDNRLQNTPPQAGNVD